MRQFRECGHALVFFFVVACTACTSNPTGRPRLSTSATTAIIAEKSIISSSFRPAIKVSTKHVVSRSCFLSTAALVTLMTPIVAGAITPEAPRASSSTKSEVTQQIEHSAPSREKAATEPSSVQESISGFFAGGALAATKTIVKYPLDTATVRLQVPGYGYSISELGTLFSGSYNGITASLLANIPAGAVFFAVKDAAKTSLKNSALKSAPAWTTTTLAVGAALIPYWIIRSPSEVIKVRQQVGVSGYGEGVSAWDALQLTFNATAAAGGSTLEGVGALYTGYWENILYSLPADVIKFVAYEALTGGKKDLLPVEGARAGAFATVSSDPAIPN